jgi:hypothetical protein
MASLWTNLLFMHGHITDPDLARRMGEVPPDEQRPRGKRQRNTPSAQAAKAGLTQPSMATSAYRSVLARVRLVTAR